MDLFLVFGLGLAAGPLAKGAPWAFGFGALALLLLLRFGRRGGAVASTISVVGLAIGAWRGGRAISEHEASRAAIASQMPATVRCSGEGTVVGAPTRASGALRFVVEVGR
ncbi:MAG: hypothetical protein JWM74_250, partial [Myxococcaceae bacterium]|nr:hypothetical protein [Myxococcaceae bacterium]